MMANPVISVLLPVYNARRYVARAVESILRQTEPRFELIVVDDGSSDGSLAILRNLARRDHRIRLISRANTGIVGALNDGLAEARAPFLARMDADDEAVATRFEKQLARMREADSLLCLGAAVQDIDPYGQPLPTGPTVLQHDQIMTELLKGFGGTIRHPVAMLRTEAVRRIGGYRREFQWAEDLDLFLRLGELGKLENLGDILLYYRQHPASVNRSRTAEQARVIESVVRDAYARRGLCLPERWSYAPPPLPDRKTQIREWGWRALKSGAPGIARKHALDAFRGDPLSLATWRLLFCAMRGWA
jgi:glycosyltransferase involved in cell wall biosynthesis